MLHQARGTLGEASGTSGGTRGTLGEVPGTLGGTCGTSREDPGMLRKCSSTSLYLKFCINRVYSINCVKRTQVDNTTNTHSNFKTSKTFERFFNISCYSIVTKKHFSVFLCQATKSLHALKLQNAPKLQNVADF